MSTKNIIVINLARHTCLQYIELALVEHEPSTWTASDTFLRFRYLVKKYPMTASNAHSQIKYIMEPISTSMF
ncbi:hypothetical protein KJ641_00765 [Patescibacteria group bacterium]|nr:hypothetical protein [Patescibacteria group bacterium]